MTPREPAKPPSTRASPRLVLALTLLVVLLAAAVYAWRGTPQALFGTPAAPTVAASAAVPATAASGPHGGGEAIQAMVQRLAERLAQQPDDAEGWSILGRSYLVLGKPEQAVAALRKRLALQPQDAQAHSDLGDALAFAAGRRFEGEPERLIRQALKLDPMNAKALELLGTMSFDRGQFEEASRHWLAALEVLDPQSQAATNLRAGVAEARRKAAAAGGQGVASAAARVSGRVTLSPALKARVQPDDTVLIFARLVDGPRMPVALLKRRAAELPLDFQLDESTAMNPSLRLSPSMQVVVGVRVSRTGQAMTQPGDLQGFSAPVPVGTGGLKIEVKDIVP
jgi:cytochrome c-type biogenesis protein CcmH